MVEGMKHRSPLSMRSKIQAAASVVIGILLLISVTIDATKLRIDRLDRLDRANRAEETDSVEFHLDNALANAEKQQQNQQQQQQQQQQIEAQVFAQHMQNLQRLEALSEDAEAAKAAVQSKAQVSAEHRDTDWIQEEAGENVGDAGSHSMATFSLDKSLRDTEAAIAYQQHLHGRSRNVEGTVHHRNGGVSSLLVNSNKLKILEDEDERPLLPGEVEKESHILFSEEHEKQKLERKIRKEKQKDQQKERMKEAQRDSARKEERLRANNEKLAAEVREAIQLAAETNAANQRKALEQMQQKREADYRKLQQSMEQKFAIKLHRPWDHYGKVYDIAKAQRRGHLCFLTGLIMGKGHGTIGFLPPYCRPSHRLMFHVLQGGDHARVDIVPDGKIVHEGGPPHGWLSLSGISFTVSPDADFLASLSPDGSSLPSTLQAVSLSPARIVSSPSHNQDDTQNHNLNLQPLNLFGRWKPLGLPWRPQPLVQAGKSCTLSGTLQFGGVTGPIAVLPASCHPKGGKLLFTTVMGGGLGGGISSTQNHSTSASASSASSASSAASTTAVVLKPVSALQIEVLTNGAVQLANKQVHQGVVTLDGISFASRHQTEEVLELDLYWDHQVENQGFRPASYSKVNHVCYLSGVILQRNNNTTAGRGGGGGGGGLEAVTWKGGQVIGRLPLGCRPTGRLVTNPMDTIRVDVFPSGQVVYISGQGAHQMMALDGIRFPVPPPPPEIVPSAAK